MEFLMEAFRRMIGHEPNCLDELSEDYGILATDVVAAVVVLYKDDHGLVVRR
jgi:hypothetical protein